MAHIALTRFIEAPPEDVWHVLADLEHQASWMADVRTLDVVSARREGAGTVIRVTSELFGLPVVRDVMEVTAWDPPSRLGVRHRGQFTGTGSFALDSMAGGTLLTWAEDFRPPFGFAGEAVFALVVRPHLRRVFARSLTNLRALVDARCTASRADGSRS